MLESNEVEFRVIDPKWTPRLMGWARWFYDKTEFPALQVIYPDLQNRFPGEAGFAREFQQPMLQADAPFGDLERRLWAGEIDHGVGWKFPENP